MQVSDHASTLAQARKTFVKYVDCRGYSLMAHLMQWPAATV